MKITELRELQLKELNDKLVDLKQEMFNLRFQQATNKLKNPARITQVRKTIARIKTLLRENEIKKGIKAVK